MMPLVWSAALRLLLAGGIVAGRAHGPTAGLPEVIVSVRSGLPARAKYQAPRAPVVLDVRGCRFTPRVTGAMAGQALEIRNADAVPHRIASVAARNRGGGVDVTVAARGTTRRYLATAEFPVRLRCDGRADRAAAVAVFAHPFFTVTGPDGAFALRDVPPGTYTLSAWHERFGARTATVTVTGRGPVSQDFAFAAR